MRAHGLDDLVVGAVADVIGLLSEQLRDRAGAARDLAVVVVRPALARPDVPGQAGDVAQILAVLVDEAVGVAVVGEPAAVGVEAHVALSRSSFALEAEPEVEDPQDDFVLVAGVLVVAECAQDVLRVIAPALAAVAVRRRARRG